MLASQTILYEVRRWSGRLHVSSAGSFTLTSLAAVVRTLFVLFPSATFAQIVAARPLLPNGHTSFAGKFSCAMNNHSLGMSLPFFGIGTHPWKFPDLSVLQPIFAVTTDDLKAKLLLVLNIIMMFGFLYGTVRIIGGAAQMRHGDTEAGKQSILAGAQIAGAPLIMRVLFELLFDKGVGL